jgi:hypothetical protein
MRKNRDAASPPPLIRPASLEESQEIRDSSSLPCPACGFPKQSGSRFCTACGVPFETPKDTGISGSTRATPPIIRPSGPSSDVSLSRPPAATFEDPDAFHCDNCGADIDMPPGLTSVRCPFCDSTYVIRRDEGDRKTHRPEFIIGFSVTKDKATDLFFEWLGKNSWFRPSDLQSKAVTDKQQGVYIPFWHFTLIADSKWSARIGEYWYRTETYTVEVNGKRETRTRVVQETEWWPLDGVFRKYYSGYMVSASKGLPQNEALAIQPYRLSNLMRFRPHFLAGWLVEEYSIDRDDALGIAKNEFLKQDRESISRFLPGDTQTGLNVFTNFEEGDTDLVLLPVHVMTYQYRGRVFRFLVNGQTGKVFGEKPWSAFRITIAIVGAAIVILLLVLFAILVMNAKGGNG